MAPSIISDPALKARIQTIVDWEKSQGHTGFHANVFRHCGVSHSQGWRILHSIAQQNEDVPYSPERRGRPAKVTAEDVHNVEEAVKEHSWEPQTMSWDSIASEMLEDRCTGSTLRRVMKVMNYFRCVVCLRGWIHPNLAKQRVEYATAKLLWKPLPEDWLDVYFSDEFYGGWGPTGKLRLIRRPGERLCKDCIKDDEPSDRDLTRVHAWAAAGFEQKSDLIIYPAKDANTNGKTTPETYVRKILGPVVRPWIEEVHLGKRKPFWLEENRDSSHGTSKRGIVQDWKTRYGLQQYVNCSASPDLAPLDSCWQPIPVQEYPHGDDDSANKLILDGWQQANQDLINAQVKSMPSRLRRCIEMEGQYIAE